MKKNILKVVTVFCFIFALFFVSCTQVHRDITPILDNIDSEEVILEFENRELIFFEDIGITSENARDYYLKITYELIEGHRGWCPGEIWYGNWSEQGIALNGLNEYGIDKINISEIIGNRNSFFVFYWANDYGNNWVNNVKFEIIKK